MTAQEQLSRIEKKVDILVSRTRPPAQAAKVMLAGGAEIDTQALTVSKDGRQVWLSPRQRQLVRLLLSSTDLVSYVAIVQELGVQGSSRKPNVYVVDLIHRLRQKLGDEALQVRYGVGVGLVRDE